MLAPAAQRSGPAPEASGAAALRIAGLRKRYGTREVLAGVELEVRAGAAFGLVGVNGAGKTTLLKCVLDLASFDAGKVEIFGVPSRARGARRRLSYVPERFTPPHYLRGREFLETMLALGGDRYDEARARALFLELELDADVLARPVRQLSKGMTQKLGLTACFLVERDLVLLDEPMSGLDPASRIAVKSALQNLVAEGRTLFFTSHVLTDVEELCDAIAVLNRGRFRFCGTPGDLCAHTGETNLERAFLRCIRHDGHTVAPVA